MTRRGAGGNPREVEQTLALLERAGAAA